MKNQLLENSLENEWGGAVLVKLALFSLAKEMLRASSLVNMHLLGKEVFGKSSFRLTQVYHSSVVGS